MYKAVNIKWDTDGDTEVLDDLPKEMELPDKLQKLCDIDMEDAMEEISDWLSDETGFCHYGFKLVSI